METAPKSFDWFGAITHGGPVGLAIMGLLLVVSIWTWIIIFERFSSLKRMSKGSEKFLQMFWESKSLSELHLRSKDAPYSPAREVFRIGYNEMIRLIQTRERRNAQGAVPFDTVKRALNKARNIEEGRFAKSMPFLAVAASASPFVGLLGTVIGIIRAFQDIAQSGSSSLAAVAPGISEALIATALGLFAAIPAVVFYNILSNRAREQLVTLDGFAADFLNILERHFNSVSTSTNNG